MIHTPFLTFFNDEKNSDIIGTYLEEVDDRVRKGYISTITVSELSYLYIRNDMRQEGEACIHALQNTALDIIPVDIIIAASAGSLKKEKEDRSVTVDPLALAATSMDHISQFSGLLK